MKRFLLVIAATVAVGGSLAACATATPYQPAPAGRAAGGFGYSQYKIDGSHWRVTFSGNSLTSRETVEKYLLYRAAELTIEQGADWFQTTDRRTERSTSYYSDPDPFYSSPFWSSYGWGWRPSWRYYGGGFGWRSWDPWYGGAFWSRGMDLREVNRYEASGEIVMGKGPPPSGERVFDAQEVVKNLGPGIARPTT